MGNGLGLDAWWDEIVERYAWECREHSPQSNPSAERSGGAKCMTAQVRTRRLRSQDGLTSPRRLRSLVAPWRSGTRR